jgi:pimeloyl-ACP methyl ester carboxylesterase
MKPSESIFLELRGMRYHVRAWGRDGAPVLVCLHGWMDVSASFQFVVDALQGDWRVLAPDWRGYGLTDWTSADCYWYPDYLADLEQLIERLHPQAPVTLVGHSMGGNVACIYAGVRPQRVHRLVNLEGLGMRDNDPAEAPQRYARWLDELAGTPRLRDYAGFEELALRLRETNPRLRADRAVFLARHWGRQREDGRVVLTGDPRHKIVNPVLYRAQEVGACLRAITAPVLWIDGAESELGRRFKLSGDELSGRRDLVPNLTHEVVPGAGHMLHHDQPERVAGRIEAFLGEAA